MVVVPVEISVRILCDENRVKTPEKRLKRAIRQSYRIQDRRLPSYDETTSVEKDEKKHPDELGTPYKATLRTEHIASTNLSRWMSALTEAVEREFDNDIIGARLIIEEDDGNSRSFGW